LLEEVAVVVDQPVLVVLVVYKYLNDLLVEIQLIQLQLVQEELQDLMEALVDQETIQ
tara:strand:+ start:72 stop:242 length:171 start_codon:yes stop_codon:yes gene_type:complete